MKTNILRLIAGVVAGTFVGALIIYALQALGQIVFPPPFEYDPADPGIFKKLSESGSLQVLLPILFSFAAGSVVGGFLAGVLSKGGNLLASILAGLILLGMGLINLMNYYHPLWFWIASLAAYPVFAILGGLLAASAKKN